MSLHLYNQVSDCALPSKEKFVLMCLAFSATNDGLAVISLERIARDTSLDLELTRTMLANLEQKGMIADCSVSIRDASGAIEFRSAYQIFAERLPAWTPELRKALLEDEGEL